MTTGPQGNGMLHHDEGHEEALGTMPVTPLVQVGNSNPQPIGQDTIPVHGMLNGSTVTLDSERAAEDTAAAIIRILARDPLTRDKEVPA
ncbi:MAG: hypothetical protein KH989_10720 [Kocuria rhizophila]|nr:hypothetical protein [Kocuria rhizophila]